MCRMQEGRDIEICNSFELDYKIVNGAVKLDTEYLEIKRDQCKPPEPPTDPPSRCPSPCRRLADKKVFPKYEPLGWYSNSTEKVPLGEVLAGDIDIHRQVSEQFENPLYVLLDTSQSPGSRELPVSSPASPYSPIPL